MQTKSFIQTLLLLLPDPLCVKIIVHFQKRAHNPFLIASGFDQTDITIPWLGRKNLQFIFG
jgi:hypothetical protein